MSILARELVTLGGLLLLALFAEAVGRHTRLPRISLLILLGILLGPAVLGLVDPRASASFDFVATLALSMVGFLVGGKLSARTLRPTGRLIVWLSLWEVVATFAVVALGLWALGAPVELALLLGAIATATDPAATLEAIRETKRDNRFSDVLAGIVAIDDAWGLILFSLVAAALQIAGHAAGPPDAGVVAHGLVELAGSVALGAVLGLPMARLSGRVRRGEPTLMEALGMVLLCAGIARWLELSHLLACVCMGITVANVARHHKRPFHAIEEIEWPFLALFFIFSGAYVTVETVYGAGGWLLAYLALRVAGRVAGGWLGSSPAWVDTRLARWVGIALLPQAGVAMAMAFVAVSSYPELSELLLPVVIAATAVFELVGPVATRLALRRSAPDGAGGS